MIHEREFGTMVTYCEASHQPVALIPSGEGLGSMVTPSCSFLRWKKHSLFPRSSKNVAGSRNFNRRIKIISLS